MISKYFKVLTIFSNQNVNVSKMLEHLPTLRYSLKVSQGYWRSDSIA